MSAYSEVRSAYRSGGGWITDAIHGRAGTVFALCAWRVGLSATSLTLVGCAMALLGSGAFVAAVLAGSPVLVLAVGPVLWHVAYALDCADGQVARFTGTTSLTGARLDLLVDYVNHASVLIAIVTATRGSSQLDNLAVGGFAATWFAGLLVAATFGATPAGDEGRFEVGPSRDTWARSLVRQPVDYGLQLLVLSVSVIVLEGSLELILIPLATTNAGVVSFHIARILRPS